MKRSVRLLICMMFVFIAASLSQVPPLEATPGFSATGAVQSEGGGRLFLNTNPCGPPGDARIVIFHNPYEKAPNGEINCYPNRFDRMTVKQH